MPRFPKIAAAATAATVAAALVAGLGGCRGKGDGPLDVVVLGTPRSVFETGPRLSPAGQLVRSATTEGLVGFDELGRVVPALADRWIVTDDGQSYIFRLRDGTWPDGTALTGESARAALRQALDAVEGTSLALDLANIDDIRAMAGRVVEIRLAQPVPDFLQLLAQPELGLVRAGKGGGPMTLKQSGMIALLTPIAPEKRGMPARDDWAGSIRTLRLRALPAAAAVDLFDRGDVDVVLGGRIEQFPRTTMASLSRGTIRIDPALGLFGLFVARPQGVLASAENREAVAMAIDRDALITAFGVGGWTPSTRILPPAIAPTPAPASGTAAATGAERWANLNIAARRAQAAARIARYRAAHGKIAQISVDLPAGPGRDVLFARLRDDLATIGLELVLARDGASADLRLFDVVARYPSAVWFFNQLSCTTQHGLCSAAADTLVASAAAEPDPARRAALIAQAEDSLIAANLFIPFGAPVRWSLVRAAVTGFAANPWGFHPLLPLAMIAK